VRHGGAGARLEGGGGGDGRGRGGGVGRPGGGGAEGPDAGLGGEDWLFCHQNVCRIRSIQNLPKFEVWRSSSRTEGPTQPTCSPHFRTLNEDRNNSRALSSYYRFWKYI
jgi:hypothetical protein